MLDSLPKVINNHEENYYLQLLFTQKLIFVSYAAQYHEDKSVFSYWVEYDNEHVLVYKTQEFIQKWVDEGNVVVRQ